MKDSNWKESLVNFFEDIKIIESCQRQTLEDFDQFCEFIAEPAFESLAEELQKHRVKSKFKRTKRKSIEFQMNFPGSRVGQFHYTIYLPKNSVELRLRLLIKGRKTKESRLETKEELFMENLDPADLLKLPKEEIIEDVIEHYKNFIYETLIKP
ncbi:MAG: hypothetical protein ACE5L7_03065 [Candidatus Aminicenantales bacterium]